MLIEDLHNRLYVCEGWWCDQSCLFVIRVQLIEQPFLMAVKEELGDRFTLSIETTYRATIFFILTELATEFTRCQQQQQQQQQQQIMTSSKSPHADCGFELTSLLRRQRGNAASKSETKRRTRSANALRTKDSGNNEFVADDEIQLHTRRKSLEE